MLLFAVILSISVGHSHYVIGSDIQTTSFTPHLSLSQSKCHQRESATRRTHQHNHPLTIRTGLHAQCRPSDLLGRWRLVQQGVKHGHEDGIWRANEELEYSACYWTGPFILVDRGQRWTTKTQNDFNPRPKTQWPVGLPTNLLGSL